jgi:hypothetical protein
MLTRSMIRAVARKSPRTRHPGGIPDSIWSLVTQRSIAHWSFRIRPSCDGSKSWLTSRANWAPRGSGMRAGAVIEEAQEAVVCPVQEVRGFAEIS